MRLVCFLIFLTLLLVACDLSTTLGPSSVRITPPAAPPTAAASPTQVATLATVTAVPTPSPVQLILCEDWQSWPVVPLVTERARELYRRGQESENNPHTFSKIGDGEISAEWFFTAFDLGEAHYNLGAYQNLHPVIDHFEGSFGRIGMAAGRGFNTQRILDPALIDSGVCEPGESPLTCELRLHRPAFAILSLGTNQVWKPEEFEAGMRRILDILISQNVLPILSTKGDNLEGDHRINHRIACLAQEYNVPLWNFWAAIQPLPNHGLQPDLEHLTYGITDFGNEDAMQTAWTVRNLTGLQALDVVWRGVTSRPQ